MEMKLMSTSLQENRFRPNKGSNSEVKKQEVAMQATPIDTLAVWMLAKKATQCRASRMPQAMIWRVVLPSTLCSRRVSARTVTSVTTLTIIRTQTSDRPPSEIIRPKIPVQPARKTAVWSRIRVRVFSFIIRQK